MKSIFEIKVSHTPPVAACEKDAPATCRVKILFPLKNLRWIKLDATFL